MVGGGVADAVARAHPVGALDEVEVRLGHLVEHDDARGGGLVGDERVQVLQGGAHAGVVLGPHEVDVPGEDRELECPGGDGHLGARRGLGCRAQVRFDGVPEAVAEGEVLLRRRLAASPTVDGGEHGGELWSGCGLAAGYMFEEAKHGVVGVCHECKAWWLEYEGDKGRMSVGMWPMVLVCGMSPPTDPIGRMLCDA